MSRFPFRARSFARHCHSNHLLGTLQLSYETLALSEALGKGNDAGSVLKLKGVALLLASGGSER